MKELVGLGTRSVISALGIAGLILVLCVGGPASAQDKQFDLNIPSQSLEKALLAFAEQADVELVFPPNAVKGITASELKGRYSRDEALRLLLGNSGLKYELTGEDTISISRVRKEGSGVSIDGPRSQLAGSNQAVAAAAVTATPNANQSDAIEEIVVTARKREERLQRVPISVAAYTAADLERRSLLSLKDLGNSTPNFEFMNNGTRGKSAGIIMIRGVGQISAELNSDPGVGVYVDGVYRGRNEGINMDLFDIERVEILRGPQGTLFGKNTIGGAVNIVTARPSFEFSGHGKVTTGRFNRIDGQLSVNVPLVDGKLAARIGGSYRNRDGFGKRLNFFTGEKIDDMGDQNDLAGRLVVLFTPSDTFEITASLDGTRVREAGPVRKVLVIEPTGPVPLLNLFIDPPYDARFLTDKPFTTYSNGSNQNDVNTWGIAATAQWTLGNIVLKSITSYRDLKTINGVDPDGSPQTLVDATHTTYQEQFSQELQVNGSFNRLLWTLGAFYYWEDAEQIQVTTVFPDLFNFIGVDVSFTDHPFQKTKSYAVFGQGTLSLTDRLNLTAGLRYSYERKRVQRSTFRQFSGVYVLPPDDRKGNWDALSPRVGLEFQWTPDILTYISAARGFKSGGFNARPKSPEDTAPYNPEFIWTYELGLKSEWLERRMRFNLVGYFSDYKDVQFQIIRATSTGEPIEFFDNAAKARIKGFEAEVLVKPIPGLELTGGLGLTDAKYTKVKPGAAITVNSKFTKTPKWSLNLSGQYSFLVGAVGVLSMRLDYAYKSKVFHDVAAGGGESDVLTQDGFSLVNARITFEPSSGRWQMALFGTNLTDTRYILAGTDFRNGLGFAEVQMGRPREWGLSLSCLF